MSFTAPTLGQMFLGLAILGTPSYPRAELLIEPAEMAKMSRKAQIVDVRARAKYLAAHVPKAIWLDAEAWSKAFAKQQDADKWGQLIGEAGIRPDRTIVIYDDALSKDAARIWWILRYWGGKDIRLLNGGWQGWLDRELPISKTVESPIRQTIDLSKAGTAVNSLLATRRSVLDSLKEKKAQIIDARSLAEHCGEDKRASKAGSIPGALHLEWSDLLDKKSQRFKSADKLRELFKKAGIDLAAPAAAHCQSGGRSSVMAFALELMGARNVSNYYRGWSEWGNSADTPVNVKKR